MAKPLSKPKSLKAQIHADLALRCWLRPLCFASARPEAVTIAKAGRWAGAPSSSVGYYFDSVTELLYKQASCNIEHQFARAEKRGSGHGCLQPEIP